MADAGARQLGARHFVADMILGHQHARDRDLAAADVRVRIDAARHHDAAVQRVFVSDSGVGRGRNDAAVLDEDIANLAVDTVLGIVDFAAGELGEHS